MCVYPVITKLSKSPGYFVFIRNGKILFLRSLNKNKLKTIILLDHPTLYRIGLKTYLQKVLIKVKIIEIETWQQLEQKMKAVPPDYIFITPENLNQTELDKILMSKSMHPQLKIIITSNNFEFGDIHKDSKKIDLAIDAIISKNASETSILEMMKTINNQKKYYCFDYLQKNILKEKTLNLSNRELEILKEIANGHDANDIASKLFISIHTFRTHRKNIMKKTGVHSTSELILYALKKKII